MLNPPINWWCCLSPVEQNVVIGILPHWFDLTFHIFQDEFDLLWALSDPDDNALRKALFIYDFGLTLTECQVDPETIAPCYAMLFPLWLEIATFSLTGDFACPDPCHLMPPYSQP